MQSLQNEVEKNEEKKDDDTVSQISSITQQLPKGKKRPVKKIQKQKETKEIAQLVKCFSGINNSSDKKVELSIDLIKMFKENQKVSDLRKKYLQFKFTNVTMNIRVNQEGDAFLGHELSWTCSDKKIVWADINNFTPNRQWLEKKNQINLNLSMTQWASFESLDALNGKMNISIKSYDDVEFKTCFEFVFNFSVKGEKSEDGFSSVMDMMKFN
jgi:hypothetical protein